MTLRVGQKTWQYTDSKEKGAVESHDCLHPEGIRHIEKRIDK